MRSTKKRLAVVRLHDAYRVEWLHEMLCVCIVGPAPLVVVISSTHYITIITITTSSSSISQCQHQHQQHCSKWIIAHRNLCCNNSISVCACVCGNLFVVFSATLWATNDKTTTAKWFVWVYASCISGWACVSEHIFNLLYGKVFVYHLAVCFDNVFVDCALVCVKCFYSWIKYSTEYSSVWDISLYM